jgi:hypothetical protein
VAYWLDQVKVWPDLAELAMGTLSRACTSAARERFFNKVKRIEGLRRLSLSDDHLRALSLCVVHPTIFRRIVFG